MSDHPETRKIQEPKIDPPWIYAVQVVGLIIAVLYILVGIGVIP